MTAMSLWRLTDYSGRFHSDDIEVVEVDDDAIDSVSLNAGDPTVLPAGRRQTAETVHRQVRRAWSGGGFISQLYELDEDEDAGEEVGPEAVISLLWDLADAQDLPPDIAGCSIAWLADERCWPETAQQFGDAVYRALESGGPSGEGLDSDEAAEMTESYLAAVFGDAEEDALLFFGLDSGFSCWFCDGEWDIAYAVINFHEGWFGLFLATDSEDD
jgi:hypothetical protein